MPTVLILANHRAVAAERLIERITRQLRAHLGPGDSLMRVDDVRRLGSALDRKPDIVLAPLAYEGEGGFRAAVEAVRVLAPEVPIIACCDVSVRPEAILAAAAADVDHLAVPAVDDIGAVVRDVLTPDDVRLARRPAQQAGSDALEELIAALPAFAARLVMAAVSEKAPRTVGELAAGVGLSERTLTRRCARWQWPTPTMILRYGRLIRGVRVALATGSVEEGAIAADCPGDPVRAATYFRARLAAATSGALRQPLTEGLVPLCVVVAERFGITGDGEPRRPRVPRARKARRTTLAAEGTRVEEGGGDGVERAGGAQLESPAPRVSLELGPQRAG